MSGFCAARRVLLLGAGAGGLAALTACGGGNGAQASTPGKTGASSAPAAQASPSAVDDPFGAFPSGGGDGGGGAPGGALVATKEVPVGGGVLAQGSTIVVQPKAGTFKAFDATCPHQGVTVNPPATGAAVMQCPGHNSEFKTADGSLVRGPATRGLAAVPVKVRNGYVVPA